MTIDNHILESRWRVIPGGVFHSLNFFASHGGVPEVRKIETGKEIEHDI